MKHYIYILIIASMVSCKDKDNLNGVTTKFYSEHNEGGIQISRDSKAIGRVHFSWHSEAIPEMSIEKTISKDGKSKVHIEVVDDTKTRHKVTIEIKGTSVVSCNILPKGLKKIYFYPTKTTHEPANSVERATYW